MPTLFDPIRLGAIEAPNRIIMAPLTRARASRDHVPTPVMAEYYAQRASAGLIISEATGISREGLGWPYAPGIWEERQVEAWKPVTEAVHRAGGRIMLQLWHMGRAVHPSYLANHPGGAKAVSASATCARGKTHTYEGRQPHEEARALEIGEIPRVVDDYVRAARNAMKAGFDGVQIHGANGYLIDQFLRDSSNLRDDDYGGPPENRIRLMREVTLAVAAEAGPERTAIRLSPNGDSLGVVDSDPAPLYRLAAEALDAIGIAFLELREQRPDGTFGRTDQPRQSPVIRRHFSGPLILNGEYRADTAQADLDSGLADAICFGRSFIANPDLPGRIRTGAPIAEADMATWYSQGEEGYVDYPALDPRAA